MRQRGLTGVVERTTEMQYLAATYAEMQKNLELLMLAIIVISVLPAVVEVLRERHKARKAAREAREK